MPTLRKALETTPSRMEESTPSSSSATSTGTRLSVCDRHPAVASLLSRPPATNVPKTSNVVSSSASLKPEGSENAHMDSKFCMAATDDEKNDEIKIEVDDGEDEQPLNLCVRDNAPA